MNRSIAIIFLVCNLLVPGLSKADLRFATEAAYAPWNYIDENGDVAGFEIDLGNKLCERMDEQCEWVLNEWDSMIPNLLAGNYDAIMAAMSITEERKQTISFSSYYFPPDPARYISAAGTDIDFDDLQGHKIGVQGATIHSAYLEETHQTDNSILKYETADQAVADLVAGNIDLLLADGPYLEAVINGSNGKFVFAGPSLSLGGGVGVGMRKGNEELQKNMQAALESVKADGTLDELIGKYFNKGPFFQ